MPLWLCNVKKDDVLWPSKGAAFKLIKQIVQWVIFNLKGSKDIRYFRPVQIAVDVGGWKMISKDRKKIGEPQIINIFCAFLIENGSLHCIHNRFDLFEGLQKYPVTLADSKVKKVIRLYLSFIPCKCPWLADGLVQVSRLVGNVKRPCLQNLHNTNKGPERTWHRH